MELNLPTPCAADLLALRLNPDGIKAALNVKSTLARIVRVLEPETIVAIAQQRNPGCSMLEAVGALSVIAAYQESEVETFNALVRVVEAEEKKLMKPILNAVVSRMFEVMREIETFPHRITLAKQGREVSVKKLIDAGASRTDAERIAGESQGESVAELEAERDALIVEHAALRTFVRTKNPVDIPAGFSL